MIRKSENETAEISIERGQVPLSQVMSFILEDEENNKKVGYIHLPRFYGGEDGCAAHVLKELAFLTAHNIEGIILDLRNNQGGSSREAIEMIGYFLEGGIVMQSQYEDGNHRIFEDPDKTAQYSGKLVVMINGRSASASELFSGTMQDYKRAVIVGNQSFGKGTMQRFFEVIDDKNSIKFGEAKLTVGSFYTGNGRSTQYNGVMPDILFPNKNMYSKTGERKIENALRFEDIDSPEVPNSTVFEKSKNELISLSKTRQLKNPYFVALNQEAMLNKEESIINLDYNAYKLYKEQSRTGAYKHNQIRHFKLKDLGSSKYENEQMTYWNSRLGNDHFVHESFLIISDYLAMEE